MDLIKFGLIVWDNVETILDNIKPPKNFINNSVKVFRFIKAVGTSLTNGKKSNPSF